MTCLPARAAMLEQLLDQKPVVQRQARLQFLKTGWFIGAGVWSVWSGECYDGSEFVRVWASVGVLSVCGLSHAGVGTRGCSVPHVLTVCRAQNCWVRTNHGGTVNDSHRNSFY